VRDALVIVRLLITNEGRDVEEVVAAATQATVLSQRAVVHVMNMAKVSQVSKRPSNWLVRADGDWATRTIDDW